jgi:hypothetical protein
VAQEVWKHKLVLPGHLSPTQFLVHDDIVASKVRDILGGAKPHVEGRQHEGGGFTLEEGHHTAAAYEALGQKVPVRYPLGVKEPHPPDYDWSALRHVSDENPEVDHPDVGPIRWGD